MPGVRKIEVDEKELPLPLEVKGENGKKKAYWLIPAGKGKIGARLGDPEETSWIKGRK